MFFAFLLLNVCDLVYSMSDYVMGIILLIHVSLFHEIPVLLFQNVTALSGK